MAVFLDSSLQNELGQYSIIGLFPWMTLVNGDKFTVNGKECGQSFEGFVKEYLKEHREENHTHLPIVSGAIGYFSYDYGRKKEGAASRHERNADIPECILCFYDVFIVEEHRAHKLYVIANGKLGDSRETAEGLVKRILETAAGGACAAAADGLQREGAAERQKAAAERCGQEKNGEIRVAANFAKKEYLKAVDDVINYITEGDIYIMNMTQQLTIQSPRTPYEVFQRLRRDNPSPFGGYFQYGDFQIILSLIHI